jgi:hypothetical protein
VKKTFQSHQKPTKNDFPPKTNHLRNRLDTTPAPPVFPPRTNDFQTPIKFVSTSSKVFFGKESEKASEEKPVEKLSGEKPNEQPVVWTSLGPLPLWVPGPTTRWAPGTTRLALHDTCWREAQGLRRRSTQIGSCTCPALYRGLLDVLD